MAENYIERRKLEAAAKEVHPEPTLPQIAASNFRHGHLRIHGLDISIEVAKDGIRKGVSKATGEEWQKKMKCHYGRIKKTIAADLEHFDVYVGPSPESEIVFVVNQLRADGGFDEHKALIGFTNAEEAQKAFLAHIPRQYMGSMVSMTMDQFKKWVFSPRTKYPLRKRAEVIDLDELDKEAAELSPAAASSILISGHSGAGKSTTSKLLSQATGYPVVAVDDDEEFHQFLKNDKEMKNLQPGTPEELEFQQVKRRAAERALASLKVPSIVEGTQLSNLPTDYLKSFPNRAFVSAPLPQIMQQRIDRSKEKAETKGRPWSPEIEEEKRHISRLVFQQHQKGLQRYRRLDGTVEHPSRSPIETLLSRLNIKPVEKTAAAAPVSGNSRPFLPDIQAEYAVPLFTTAAGAALGGDRNSPLSIRGGIQGLATGLGAVGAANLADQQGYGDYKLPAGAAGGILSYLIAKQLAGDKEEDGKPWHKKADLLPGTSLQPHQQRLEEEAEHGPLRKLMVWGVGSGKSLGSIAASETRKEPYVAVVPASLRNNFRKELDRWTDHQTPTEVMSYSAIAQGKQPQHYKSIIADEAQNLKNPDSLRTQKFMQLARQADQVLMLSGTPLVNRPGDLAVPTEVLTGRHFTPDSFEKEFMQNEQVKPGFFARMFGIKPGDHPAIKNEKQLKSLLEGKVDWHMPDKPVVPTQHEDIEVEMSPEQSALYRSVWDKLPWHLRWKFKNQFPLSGDEMMRARSFLTGPRQVSLSTLPYMNNQDPYKAFEQSSKLKKAMELLQVKLKDDRAKALIFSNFIDAGLTPYAAALAKANIPHAVFHGGLTDAARKKLVDDYNSDKIRVALLGPSGSEGLSFKGTQLIQLLDPHWSGVRGKQSVGRGLRFDSHAGLPEDLQNVHVQRFIARQPLSMRDRALAAIGFDRGQNTHASDDYLLDMEKRKEELNSQFMDVLREIGSKKAG